MSTKSAFRNQRPAFRNPSLPYAEKTLDHPRWLFPSRKNGRQVACWTAGEFRAVVAFEAASPLLVQSYEERPELVALRDGPDWYRYIPSFRVILASGPVMVELSSHGTPGTRPARLWSLGWHGPSSGGAASASPRSPTARCGPGPARGMPTCWSTISRPCPPPPR